MIIANFNAYNSYVTDSVYQWDIDHDLVISGLNLSVAPEIHFANANMDRAIVRQSALNAGIVTVRIPNSLLQEAITVKAYVGVYEDDTFKVIETIEIPVIAKARPSDYTIEDTDEEIYSFNKLENEIVNAKKEISDKCDANLLELAVTVTKTATDFENEVNGITNTLSAQVANIVAHNNDTDGNSELIDIRTGANGAVYPSAGDAVRGQIAPVVSDLRELVKFELTGKIDNTGLSPDGNAWIWELVDTNTEWTFYRNVYPSSAGVVENRCYWWYYLVAQKDFVVWADDNLYTGSNDMWLCLYNSTDFSDVTQQISRTRLRKDDIDGNITTNTVPKANSKMIVKAGQVLAISIYKHPEHYTYPTFRINVSGMEGLPSVIGENILLNDRQISQVQEQFNQSLEQVREEVDQELAQVQEQFNQSLEQGIEQGVEQIKASEKKCRLKYGTLSQTSYHATEALYIYIPSKVGYVRYDFYHNVWDSHNTDSWRLNNCFAVDDTFVKRFGLTEGGEIECAIRLVDRDDFSGGAAHGDEIVDEIVFFVDGVKTDVTTLTENTEFKTLRIIETSRLYDPADHTTVIAKHGREYQFSDSGMALDQYVKWEVVADVDIAYMAMFTPKKTDGDLIVTNKAYASSDFETVELNNPIGNPLWFPNAKKVALWSEESGFYSSVEVTEYPTGLTGGDRTQISDNGGLNYNKVYFYLTDDHKTTVGETWRSKAKFELEVGEGTSTT